MKKDYKIVKVENNLDETPIYKIYQKCLFWWDEVAYTSSLESAKNQVDYYRKYDNKKETKTIIDY